MFSKNILNSDQKELVKTILTWAAESKDATEYILESVYQLLIQRIKVGLTFDIAPTTSVGSISYLRKDHKLSFSLDSKKANNNLIIGENYDALNNLILIEQELNPSDPGYDIIYIDPPYNTESSAKDGNNAADDKEDIKANKFVYRDKFSRNGWLNMLRERLVLAKQLLNLNGVIFVSIDDNEQAYLKILMDEIFGEENFVANFIWEKNYSPKNNNKFVSVNHDYILCYLKNRNWVTNFNRFERTEKQNSMYVYDDNDGRGRYCLGDLTKKGKNTYDIEWNGKIYKCPENSGWRFNKTKTKELIADNRIYLPDDQNHRPRMKRYLSEVADVISLSILPHKLVGHTGEAKQHLNSIIAGNNFDTPKSVRLIEYLIKLIDTGKTRVLDFYAGSCATAEAVLELNQKDGGSRTYTMVTNNANEIGTKIAYERLFRINHGVGTKGENFKWTNKNMAFNSNLSVYWVEQTKVGLTDEQNLDELVVVVKKMLGDFGVTNTTISVDRILSKLRSLKSFIQPEKADDKD
ncbi:site-specific DNA-methyltransferase [Mycoplasmopsis columbinasalis]|uniref:C-terminal truncated Type III restriction-modification system: methylase n=1 Tax=Mycoplasmopsis columbinasalis TaxID=114880 RepID=A0A449BAW4_9BACT|nr:site-specific DNA-methyltransferase [Mycoplasmopsis columbinasalis]VEU78177.1 C-terminal truncated Type III restriction-modification system: methylase [Mycoplasmopsis columbinasalis]